MKYARLALLALGLSTSVYAKAPTMKLNCAKVKGYETEVERQFVNGIYNINVTFITKRPDNQVIDKALRDCLAVSVKLDDTKDILANSWFRPIAGMDPNDDEMIKSYGSLTYIAYTASNKAIEIRTVSFKK